MKFSKWIVLLLFLITITFIVANMWLYYKTGGVPDTLIISTFTWLTGELGFLSMIRTKKEAVKNGETIKRKTVRRTNNKKFLD